MCQEMVKYAKVSLFPSASFKPTAVFAVKWETMLKKTKAEQTNYENST